MKRFILTGQTDYEGTTALIAVSNDESKLVKLQSVLETLGEKDYHRKKIITDYKLQEKDRYNSLVEEPNLSKDHLPMTSGKERFEINKANAAIDARNFEKRSTLCKIIEDEGRVIADITIPLSTYEESLLRWISDSYCIEEIDSLD